MADINVIVLPDGTEYPVSDYYIPVAISNPTNGQVLKYDATNHVWYNGDDTGSSSILYGTSAPTSQLGTDGCLYVKYTEGTGGASDTVDALYVKLDGSWCQISTGGGGGTSDYSDLTNKPQINSVELSGNKSLDDLGIQPSEISKTATGSIVTFSDGGDDIPVSEYECDIVAQQASGTPTPVSPLPITGFSQADISVSGKNLVDETQFVQGSISGTGKDTVSYTRLRSPLTMVKPNTAYAFATNSALLVFEIHEYDKNGTWFQYTNINNTSGTITTTANTGYIKILIRNSTNTPVTVDELTTFQMEKGNVASAYAPYISPNLYTVSFGQTIYGGKLVYKNGQWAIEATYGYARADSLSWYKNNTSPTQWLYYTRSLLGVAKASGDCVCSHCPSVSEPPIDVLGMHINADKICYLNFLDAIGTNDLTSFNAYLTNNDVQLVYELATPTIIPITSSTRVKTISGNNNIFSNTGDNSVKYFTENADSLAELIKASESESTGYYHDYSTDEQVIGTWIDGNTLYEKTVVVTNKTSQPSDWAEVVTLSDVDKVAHVEGWFTISTVDYFEGYYVRFMFDHSTNKLKYYCQDMANTNGDITVIIRYTKSS